MQNKIPLTVLVLTKEEETNLPRCLAALQLFDDIIVVDSNSADRTQEIAASWGMRVESFIWNGAYPKKRQWCLDFLTLKHDRVFFVDADEEVTPALVQEIKDLDWKACGYFVKGAYIMRGKPLKFGLKNNKLCLFDRRFIEFPVVDDLDIDGMGEIEGHYQPVFKKGVSGKIGFLKAPLYHHAMDDIKRYKDRHKNYAQWERIMRARKAYPHESTASRKMMKALFSFLKMRAGAGFFHSFVLRGGFMDGMAGFYHAKNRYDYYKSIEAVDKETARRA